MSKENNFIIWFFIIVGAIFMYGQKAGGEQSVFAYSPSRGAAWPMWTVISMIGLITITGVIWLSIKKK